MSLSDALDRKAAEIPQLDQRARMRLAGTRCIDGEMAKIGKCDYQREDVRERIFTKVLRHEHKSVDARPTLHGRSELAWKLVQRWRS